MTPLTAKTHTHKHNHRRTAPAHEHTTHNTRHGTPRWHVDHCPVLPTSLKSKASVGQTGGFCEGSEPCRPFASLCCGFPGRTVRRPVRVQVVVRLAEHDLDGRVRQGPLAVLRAGMAPHGSRSKMHSTPPHRGETLRKVGLATEGWRLCAGVAISRRGVGHPSRRATCLWPSYVEISAASTRLEHRKANLLS